MTGPGSTHCWGSPRRASPARRPGPSRGARNWSTPGTHTRRQPVLSSLLGLNREAPDEAESAANLPSLRRRRWTESKRTCVGHGAGDWGAGGGVRVALALGIVHPSLARPRPPLSPLGLDPASLGPVAVLPAPSPGRLAMLPPKRSDLRPDPASGRPADAHGHLCLSPPGPGRGRGARRAAGRCSEGRRVCGPAARRPPAALRGTRTPSRGPQMLIPRPTGRALEHNDVAVNITTQADGLEAEGVSQSAERKGREWAGTGQRGAARGSEGQAGRGRRPQDVQGDWDGEARRFSGEWSQTRLPPPPTTTVRFVVSATAGNCSLEK